MRPGAWLSLLLIAVLANVLAAVVQVRTPVRQSVSTAMPYLGQYGLPQKPTWSPVRQYGLPQQPTRSTVRQYGLPQQPTRSPVWQYGMPQQPTRSPVWQYGLPQQPTRSPVWLNRQPQQPTARPPMWPNRPPVQTIRRPILLYNGVNSTKMNQTNSTFVTYVCHNGVCVRHYTVGFYSTVSVGGIFGLIVLAVCIAALTTAHRRRVAALHYSIISDADSRPVISTGGGLSIQSDPVYLARV